MQRKLYKKIEVKMSRPKITLNEWLNTDLELKDKFIERELGLKNGYNLLKHEGNSILGTDSTIATPNLLNSHHHKFNGIWLTAFEFEKLKAKYRVYKKNINDKDLIKKQYKFKEQTCKRILKLKGKNKFSREEEVIEFLLNEYNKKDNLDEKVKVDWKHVDESNFRGSIVNNLEELKNMINSLQLIKVESNQSNSSDKINDCHAPKNTAIESNQNDSSTELNTNFLSKKTDINENH